MSQASNDPIPITTALNISALARDNGVSRRTAKRRLAKGWRPPAPTPPIEARAPLGTPGRSDPVNRTVASMASACPPMSLAQLRDDIKEWVVLHRKVSRLKARARSGRTEHTGRTVPNVMLVVAVAFYALIALAAVH